MLRALAVWSVVFHSLSSASVAAPAIPWSELKNPIYSRPGWSVKDAVLTWKDGSFYLFFSAFFEDRGQERCHVAGVKSPDLRSFSEPLFVWSGEAEGWKGLCSPDLTEHDGLYTLTYNSWGDLSGKPNRLFQAQSRDLENWVAGIPLAPEATGRRRAIDAAIARDGGRTILFWKETRTSWGVIPQQVPVVAIGADPVQGPWKKLGRAGEGWHENSQLSLIDGVWHLLATGKSFEPILARLEGDPANDRSWAGGWSGFRKLAIPREGFNTRDRANAASLLDWRAVDGHFYLLYAGNTEKESHAGRGDNRLGLARSRDLVTWSVPGGGATSGRR